MKAIAFSDNYRATSMKAIILSLAFLLGAITSSHAQGQKEKKALTNADVVQMVKSGLAESVVIGAIQSSPADYDTSPTGLIELNKQGITTKVLDAMLAAQKPASATLPAIPTSLLNRVFLLNGAERVEMKQNKGEYDHVAAPFFLKVFLKFQGRQAEFRVTNGSPVFELALMGNWVAGEHVKLVKPDVTKDRRELTVQGMAGPGVPIKPDKKANLALSFEQIRREIAPSGEIAVHRVKPVGPLSPGEYILLVDQTYYCFGVDPAK